MFTATGFDDDILKKIDDTGVFGENLFICYDPASLADKAQGLNPPICGVIYEGLVSQSEEDGGESSYLTIAVIVLGPDKIRERRDAVTSDSITVLLDKIRAVILRTDSPSKHPWSFELEVPFSLPHRGMGYYQKWKTEVMI